VSIDLQRRLRVEAGFASLTGRRETNEDYVAACIDPPMPMARRGLAAVVADGVGGHSGGRVAAETAVRGFLDAYYAMPETLGVLSGASRALESVNGWIHAQGRVDSSLTRMATTFSALLLRRRTAHVLHVGDSRVYRLSDGRLECLTQDHVAGRGDLRHVLMRAIGLEDFVKFDHHTLTLRPHDRFLLCSDGVHGTLDDRHLADLLSQRSSPDDLAHAVVEAALAAGSTDNATALVLDIIDVPAADQTELGGAIAALPLLDLPAVGETIDGFRLDAILSEGRYTRLFRATDTRDSREFVLKFPHPRVASEGSYRLAFIREAWVASRMRNPAIGEIVELTPERQTRLYSVMPFYDGETLEQRLKRKPRVELAEGIAIATRLARATTALHRARIIHRDIKPDNVILLGDGRIRLIDLGVARVPDLEDFPATDIPGTASYMAPELFRGESGDETSDLYALGVTVYRMFCNAYPYGEVEPFQTPRFKRYMPIAERRPDLPAWLDAAVRRAVAVQPSARHSDVLEFAYELENGATWTAPVQAARRPLYARNPLLVWKMISAILAACCLYLLSRR
jgi:serine/threonine protein phosphatase PrpC